MKGVIYQIKTADGLYVGSTIDFNIRCNIHRWRAKQPDRRELLYNNIIANNGIYKLEIYCNVNCRDKRHLEFFEEQYRIILDANLNQNSAYGLDVEKVKKRNSQKNICECGGKYIHHNRAKHFKSQKHLKYIKDSQAPPL